MTTPASGLATMSKPAAASLIAWRPIPPARCTIERLTFPGFTVAEPTGWMSARPGIKASIRHRAAGTVSTCVE